jgi:thymidine phosphorylase
MLALAGVAADVPDGEARARAALDGGAAAERFACMVAGLGGPADVLSPRFAGLARTREVLPVPASTGGFVTGMDTRALGLVVVDLGGGRRRAGDAVDARVGLSHVVTVGQRVKAGDALAHVNAARRADAEAARARVAAAITIDEQPAAEADALIERIAGG